MNLFNLAEESRKFLSENSTLLGNMDSSSLRGFILMHVFTEKSKSETK